MLRVHDSRSIFFNSFKSKLVIFFPGFLISDMQIEKAVINDRLRVLKVSWNFRIPTIYNFAVMYLWNLLSS